MLYFAYGSNMSKKRLEGRASSAKRKDVAYLYKHKLSFHKKSKDGSGRCDACSTSDSKDYVLGVLYEVDESEKTQLDRVEGFRCGYDKKTVDVKNRNGDSFKAVTYYATETDENLKPYTWYKQHVLKGACENNFPEKYINQIESVEAKSDSDSEREKREMSIYR